MERQTTASGRSLLVCGMLVGPLYLATGLIQAFIRDGFDLARHSLSVLANGPGGWVQTANFILSGLMVIGAAIGLGRILRPQSRTVGWFLGCFGLGMLIASVFPLIRWTGSPLALLTGIRKP
jgi:hypothetical membrane protein